MINSEEALLRKIGDNNVVEILEAVDPVDCKGKSERMYEGSDMRAQEQALYKNKLYELNFTLIGQQNPLCAKCTAVRKKRWPMW